MFKFLRIYVFSALLLCCNSMIKADSETFRVKFIGTADASTIPFGTENVKMLFGNTYTTGKVWGSYTRTINETTVYTVNCDDNAKLADGVSNPNGKIPAKGCYYQFTPLKDGTLDVKLVIRTTQERNLYIIDENGNSIYNAVCVQDDNTQLPYSNNAFTIPNTTNAYRSINCRVNVSAGTTYYIYGGSTRPGFAGYDFYPAGATETLAFTKTDDANKYVGTTKTFDNTNVTLTLGEDGTADATKQWKWENRVDDYVSYLSGTNASLTDNGIPASGCYTRYTAKTDGKLVVRLITKTGAGKSFKIIDKDGNGMPAVCIYEGKRLESTEAGTFTLPNDNVYHLILCEIDAKVGGDYYIYGVGTRLGFAGYDFMPAGTAESLDVDKDQKPGKTYQTLSRSEEKYAEDNSGTLQASLSLTPALYITLGNGTWSVPVTIKSQKEDGYKLASHFEWEIIPDSKSVPTDGKAPNSYFFDGNENKSLPVKGAFYTITAMKSGTIYLYFDKDDKTKFGQLWITDSKGNPVEDYPNGIYDNKAEGGIALYNTTQSFMFHATAGTTYYIFNSQREWDGTSYNNPNRIRLAGVIYSDGKTNITDTYYYNIMSGNVHEVGDHIKTPGMVMTFGGQDKKNNIYTMAKQDDVFIAYEADDNVELRYGYATAGNETPTNELRNISGMGSNTFSPNTNTHSLPYYGTFYKFEPQCSGELTVHVLQNGALDLDENGIPSSDVTTNKALKVRPLYIADEKGNIITAKEVRVSGRLKYGSTDNGYDFTSYKDYGLYKEQWEKASKGGNFEISKTADGSGYMLINKAYCKYIFDVKPGKTYFVFTNGSKAGFCGYKFIPAGTTPAAMTLNDNSADKPLFTENTDVTIDYTRSFKADTWMPVTLPYSMTETQVENTFGKGTMVIYFDGISGNTIKFKKHNYQMIVAGRPCFVKPTKNGDAFGPADADAKVTTLEINKKNVTFTPSLANVTIDGATIEPAVNGETTGTLNGKFVFTLNASYTMQENALQPNDYYFGGDGKLYRTQEGETWNIKGYRSFFKCSDNTSGAKAILAGADFGEDSGTTAIDNIDAGNTDIDNADAVIYDLSGRIVKTGTEGLKDLVKGVYIVNGKKVTVK